MKFTATVVAILCGIAQLASAMQTTAQFPVACTSTTGGAATCVPLEVRDFVVGVSRESKPQADQGQLMLRFQLIEATSRSAPRDPAIANVDSVLRDLFRYGGYRMISEAAVAAMDGGRTSQILSGGGETYSLSVTVMGPQSQGRRGGGGGAEVVLSQVMPTRIDITLSTVAPFTDPAGAAPPGSAAAETKNAGAVPPRSTAQRTVLQTAVTISPGHTIVLGSTQPGGPDRALILVLKPEIRKY